MNVKYAKLAVIVLLASSSLYGGATTAQEGEKAKPILGVITHEELLQGKIAYATRGKYSLVNSSLVSFPVFKIKTAPASTSWLSSAFIVVGSQHTAGTNALVLNAQTGEVVNRLSPSLKYISSYLSNTSVLSGEKEKLRIETDAKGTIIIQALNGDKEVIASLFEKESALCKSYSKVYDYKLSSNTSLICSEPEYSFGKKYRWDSSLLQGLPPFKNKSDWFSLQKNFFLDTVRSPNGGFYFKGGILHEPLYRDGLEVWEPLTEEPTKSFTPVWGMRVKGGAILADAIKSDKGVCGKEGFSQAYWLKTQKGEQLLHVNTKNSYWMVDSISPDGCNVAVWSYTNNSLDCGSNRGQLSVLNVCELQVKGVATQ